ncbi:thioredoxin [Chengkuizengella axinellae]|uniref:Thioredoxin n=1 Tax=Chengkuizengella axinellae TaxID=3064388 RepID=A0ABT9J2A9_9BACL|nr:thioredoxin [Chengkuizengella sp. 2205SS18-9]MDP5275749.1 thioredoxin [Chengkuizengella sp. 2205SS18-9]
MGAVVLNKENFDQTISQGVTLVDFWAPWCGPCKIQLPIVEELAGELNGKVTIAKINVDENPELAALYSVQSIPTLLIFQNGEVAERMVGVQSKEVLIEKLTQAIA